MLTFLGLPGVVSMWRRLAWNEARLAYLGKFPVADRGGGTRV